MSNLPQKNRVYSSEHFNSERWNGINYRDDDIIVSTAMKSGTTWMLRIVGLMVFQDTSKVDDEVMHAPWPDAAFAGPPEAAVEEAEGIKHRRFMKSHVPLDGLRYDPNVKYINVVRDVRDNFMSLDHHWSGISDDVYKIFDDYWHTPFPRYKDSGTVQERWRRWMTEGKHEWVNDGYPFQSVLNFTESFWNYRHVPNILLVHYSDLKTDLEGEMRRVAKFLNVDIDDADWPAYVEAATFDSMKRDLDKMVPSFDFIFSHGATGFMNKGTNNRWKGVLSDEDLTLYEEKASALNPQMRNWLENGRLITGEQQDW